MNLRDLDMKDGNLYFIPLSGQEEEVGQSHLLGTKQDGFILVDLGLDSKHAFSDISPYIDNLRAIFITHAHNDHMGGIVSYLAARNVNEDKNNKFPPIYGLPFTVEKIKYDLNETGVPNSNWPNFIYIDPGEVVQFDDLSIRAIPASHSIPTLGYVVRDLVGNNSVFITGDTTVRGEFSLDIIHSEADKGISLLLIDAAEAIIPGMAKDLKALSLQVNNLIKNNQEDIVFVLPPSRPYHALAIKETAQRAGYGVVYSDGYKNGFLNVAESMGIDVGKSSNRNVFITDDVDSMQNLNDKSKVVFVGRPPEKLLKNQLYISMAAHGQREDIMQIISAAQPRWTAPTHSDIDDGKAFIEMCLAKKIPSPNCKVLNGSILEISKDGIIEKGRLNPERMRLTDGGLVKVPQHKCSICNNMLMQLKAHNR